MTMLCTNDVGHPNTLEREQAARVLDHANKQYQSIRGRNDLSDLGKQAHIAAVHLSTRSKLDDLQKSEQDQRASEKADAEQTLFSRPNAPLTGANAVAHRDAADRASQLTTPSAASQLLSQAQSSNDWQLAGAVAAHANTQGWRSVVAQHVGDDPEKRAAFDNLNQHNATVGTAQDKMTRDMIFRVGRRPR